MAKTNHSIQRRSAFTQKDPGIWQFIYTGFILMIAGCFITFFLPHQQLLVDVRPRGRSHQIEFAGIAPRHKVGIQRKVELLAEALEHKLAHKLAHNLERRPENQTE